MKITVIQADAVVLVIESTPHVGLKLPANYKTDFNEQETQNLLAFLFFQLNRTDSVSLISFGKFPMTSLSVGDTVMIDDRTFRVEAVGFREVV